MIPDGMTPERFEEILENVAARLAQKFKFGYHEIDDMKQEAKLEAIKGMSNYDGIRPLENFLYIHVRNRLYNNKRNKYSRPEKPCIKCPLYNAEDQTCKRYDNKDDCELYSSWTARNEKKKSLMNTVKSEDYNEQDYIHDTSARMDSQLLFDTVDYLVPVQMREDWLRFINNLKLPKQRRESIQELIETIVKENNIGT